MDVYYNRRRKEVYTEDGRKVQSLHYEIAVDAPPQLWVDGVPVRGRLYVDGRLTVDTRSDGGELTEYFESLGWTYIGTENSLPLLVRNSGPGPVHVIDSPPTFARFGKCTGCGKYIKRSEKTPWTTFPGDGATSYCDVGGEAGHAIH